jgi:hypothetical protein
LDKCPGESVNLDATEGLDAYAWFHNGLPAANTQMYSTSATGSYHVVGYDINACPDTSAIVLVADWNCDDGDPCTDDSCTPGVGCVNTYSGDDDSDGTCNNLDLCPQDPNKITPGTCGCGNTEPGTTCDDEDETTIDDLITDECECIGTPIPCPGDIDGDFIVGINDFISLNSAYGSTCTGCAEDINEDGVVGIEDFLVLNSNYGTNCLALFTNIISGPGLNPQLKDDLTFQEERFIHPELSKQMEVMAESMDFEISPNPNEGNLFMIWLNTSDTKEQLVNVEVLDLTGKRVFTQDVYTNREHAPIAVQPSNTLESGVYLVHLRMGAASYTKRMTVQ